MFDTDYKHDRRLIHYFHTAAQIATHPITQFLLTYPFEQWIHERGR
jgi:hypothetical protein